VKLLLIIPTLFSQIKFHYKNLVGTDRAVLEVMRNTDDLSQRSSLFLEIVDPNGRRVLRNLIDYGLKGVLSDEDGIWLPPCRGRQYLPGAIEESELAIS
jgi:hypothetical protein